MQLHISSKLAQSATRQCNRSLRRRLQRPMLSRSIRRAARLLRRSCCPFRVLQRQKLRRERVAWRVIRAVQCRSRCRVMIGRGIWIGGRICRSMTDLQGEREREKRSNTVLAGQLKPLKVLLSALEPSVINLVAQAYTQSLERRNGEANCFILRTRTSFYRKCSATTVNRTGERKR